MADEEKDKKKEKDDEKEEKKDKKEKKDEKDTEKGADETTEAPGEVETPEELGDKLDIPKIEVMDFKTFVIKTYGQEEADALGLPDETEEPEDTSAAGDLESMPDQSDETQMAGADATGAPADATGAPADATGAPADATGAPADATGAPALGDVDTNPPV